jgi:hypothetical protein
MPRKKDPNKPIRERAKLDTAEQINFELKKLYRLYVNKKITAAEMSRRRELLIALRAGLPETIERPQSPPTPIHISTVAAGQQFLPGGEILMPFDEAGKVWRAYNAGAEVWSAYLLELEPKLTRAAFENLCLVPSLERSRELAFSDEPLLHLVTDDV